MLYVTALLLSPVAIWLCGRSTHALANLALWLVAIPLFSIGRMPAVLLLPIIDALFIVHEYYGEQRVHRLVRLVQEGRIRLGE